MVLQWCYSCVTVVLRYQLHVLEEGGVVDVGALVVPRVQCALGGGESVPGGGTLCYRGVLQRGVISEELQWGVTVVGYIWVIQ
jgi:hypothetical protein